LVASHHDGLVSIDADRESNRSVVAITPSLPGWRGAKYRAVIGSGSAAGDY